MIAAFGGFDEGEMHTRSLGGRPIDLALPFRNVDALDRETARSRHTGMRFRITLDLGIGCTLVADPRRLPAWITAAAPGERQHHDPRKNLAGWPRAPHKGV